MESIMKSRLVLLISMLGLVSLTLFGQVRINEVCPMNYSVRYNQDGSRSDWIELKNFGDQDVNLKGWRINDDKDFENAYVFPDTVIKAGGFLLLNCDDSKEFKNAYRVRCRSTGIHKWSDEQGYSFRYKKLSGDFSLSMKFENWREKPAGEQKIGLFITSDTTNTPDFCFLSFNRSVAIQYINCVFTTGDSAEPRDRTWVVMMENNDRYRIKLTKKSDTVFVFSKFYADYWLPKDTLTGIFGNSVYAGFAATSGRYYSHAEFDISELKFNDKDVDIDDWSQVDIQAPEEAQWEARKELFADFKLDGEGETVYLFSESNEIVDSLNFPELYSDITYGIDSLGNLCFFEMPTPEKECKGGELSICDMPVISSSENSFFNSAEEVLFESTPGELYYTLNGDIPDTSSLKYNGNPVLISESSPLRAVVYQEGKIHSDILTKSYFIAEDEKDLDIFALTVDSSDYRSDEILEGLVGGDNYKVKWLKTQGYIEAFSRDEDLLFGQKCEVKIDGNFSRSMPQKTHRITARSSLGGKKFDYPLFGKRGMKEYDKFSLRNGGNDFPSLGCADFIASTIAEKLGVFHSKAEPAILFLNGDYYGKINLREKIDEDLISEKAGVSEASINFGEIMYDKYGSTKDFETSLQKMKNIENKNSEEFQVTFEHKFVLEDLTDYFLVNYYLGNDDWIANNVLFWSSDEYDSRYRFIVWDNDRAFGSPHFDALGAMQWYNNPRFIDLMTSMFGNEEYRNYFINRGCDLLNTDFSSEKFIPVIDSVFNTFSSELPAHTDRWFSDSPVNFDSVLNYRKNFITEAEPLRFSGIERYFGLDTSVNITLTSNIKEVAVRCNTIYPKSFPWSGTYFAGVEIELEALDTPGFVFKKWAGAADSKERILRYTPKSEGSNKIEAIYISGSGGGAQAVINEIMYKSRDDIDAGDWIELHNPGNSKIDIGNWIIKDDNDNHVYTVPDETELDAGGYLIICKDLKDFYEVHPDVKNVIGEFDFGFGEEDKVRLFNPGGSMIDEVDYLSKDPWYSVCYGEGPSLECINPKTDNRPAWNWQPSLVDKGTPGEQNSRFSAIREDIQPVSKIYPNPADDFTILTFHNRSPGRFEISIVDVSGNVLIEKNPIFQKGGRNSFRIDTQSLLPGTYHVRIISQDKNNMLCGKFTIVR